MAKYGGSPLAFKLKGEALAGLDRHEDALSAYGAALTSSSDDSDVLKGRAFSLARLKRFDEAHQSIQILLNRSPSDPWSHYWKSTILLEEGRGEESLKSLNRALYYGGSTPAFLAQKGEILLHLGRAEEGLRIVEDTLSSHPNEVSLLTAKASLLLGLAKHQEALEHLEGALGRIQGERDLWILKARALEALDRWEEAMETLDVATTGGHIPKDVWLQCSDLYMKMGQEEASLACLDRAIEVNPRDSEFWKARGRFCEKTSRWREAVQSYSMALEIAPEDEKGLCAMGRAYVELGMYAQAKDAFRRALSLDPTLEEAVEGSQRVEERQREGRVEAYAWRILELEAANARPATKEEVFKYCNIPVDLLDEAIDYVNEPRPLDILSIPEEELRRLEALSRDILYTTPPSDGPPPLYEVMRELPHLDLYNARRALGYMQGVLMMEVSQEQAPGMERLMKLALEVPKEEWGALSLARNLRIGAYQAKRLEGALRIFQTSEQEEKVETTHTSGAAKGKEGRICRKHGSPGIYEHFCGQYLCSACIVGGNCPVCQHPVSRGSAWRGDEEHRDGFEVG